MFDVSELVCCVQIAVLQRRFFRRLFLLFLASSTFPFSSLGTSPSPMYDPHSAATLSVPSDSPLFPLPYFPRQDFSVLPFLRLETPSPSPFSEYKATFDRQSRPDPFSFSVGTITGPKQAPQSPLHSSFRPTPLCPPPQSLASNSR